MISSTFVLASGIAFLIAARVSGDHAGRGLVIFIGLVLVAIGCALHLAALIGRLGLPAMARVSLVAACWLVVALGTAWLVGRAPALELLAALMIVPPLVGFVGLLARRTDPLPAVPFLVLSLVLTAVLVPAWLERQGTMAVLTG